MKIVMPNWRPWPQVNVGGLRHFGHLLALGLAGITLLYAEHAVAKPVAAWHLIDLLSEGLAVVMLGVWLVQLRASRPEGHVTTLLCLGLASLLAGSWADLMDEFWKVPHQVVWLWGLESSLNLLGMGLLTWGLQQWRGEQLALNQQQQRRERLFREHRSVDALTQLGDASYMQAQLLRERAAGHPGQLLMLAWPGLEAVQREHGLVAAEKLLQEAAQMLLLYLQPDELLCRYAAQHWLVLLPERSGPAARERSALLLQALQLFAQARAPKAPPPQGVSAEVLSPLLPDALMLSLLQTLEDNEARK
ncbi:GGDEF domain-containing protein [Ideonella margarita]|uniref:Diguanylate cyclase n=1 Tax=Ideonella margarita TaxID=2984191 RepID=A0ABU9CBX5_9BURK